MHYRAQVGETVTRVFLHLGVVAPGTIRAHCRAKEVLPRRDARCQTSHKFAGHAGLTSDEHANARPNFTEAARWLRLYPVVTRTRAHRQAWPSE